MKDSKRKIAKTGIENIIKQASKLPLNEFAQYISDYYNENEMEFMNLHYNISLENIKSDRYIIATEYMGKEYGHSDCEKFLFIICDTIEKRIKTKEIYIEEDVSDEFWKNH